MIVLAVGGGAGEELRASGTRGGLRLLVGLGDKLSGGKNKDRERGPDLGFRWLLLDGGTQQPTEKRPYHSYNVGGDECAG